MARIWSPEHKVVLERQLWIAVLRGAARARARRPAAVIEDYRAVVDKVDLESIAARERVTRHDVKARIEEFCALAGHEHIHKGMTSRDLTENVEQLQVRSSLLAGPRQDGRGAGAAGARSASEHATLVMAGRTHNVAAQATTLGKRFASAADELLVAYQRVDELIARYPLRGIKGPVGTSQDMLDLLGGDASKAGRARASRSRAPRLRAGARQRRPGLPALARLRRRQLRWCSGGGAVVAGHDDPADGRQRARDRGLQGRARSARRRCRTR